MRIALLVLTAIVLGPAPVQAQVPSPANSTAPGAIHLVGRTAGMADTSGRFHVVFRDLANNPVPDAPIVVDFANAPEFELCAEGGLPGNLVNATSRIVTAMTNAQGRADFVIVGHSRGAAQTLRGTVRIFASGILLTNSTSASGMICAAPDLDGQAGYGANDISMLLTDIGSEQPWQRSDLDGSGWLGANDLSVLLTWIGAATSTESCP